MKSEEAKQQEGQGVTRKFLSTEGVAKQWGLSKWTIYRLVKEGRLKPIVGLTKGWLFLGNEIDHLDLTRI